MKPARKLATYQDVIDAPEHMVAEIVDGELYTSPRPAVPHARSATVLSARLVSDFDGPPGTPDAPGGWWFLIEPELHLGADVLVPDIAAWRRERWTSIPNVVGITDPPDWVCEVLSPSTARLDRAKKMRVYARERVGHLWLLDPIVRLLETYRLADGEWVLIATHEGDASVRAEPFDAIELAMRRWWLEP
jgi:Uma2 family endonuclease